ncbi:hypothetical protein AAVH_25301 [Aphelenchoides avenae]|nr:hypothetical protein AAVH_25301 [Aphelenchus avenae]
MTDSFLDSSVVTLNDPNSFVEASPPNGEKQDPLLDSDLFTVNDENSEPGVLFDGSDSDTGSDSPPRKKPRNFAEQNGNEADENGSEPVGSEASEHGDGYVASSEDTGGPNESDSNMSHYEIESSSSDGSCTLRSVSEASNSYSTSSSGGYEPSEIAHSDSSSSSSSSSSSPSSSSEDDLEDYCGLYDDRYYDSVRRHRWY